MNEGSGRNVPLRIRVGMDVYDALGQHYLGSVVRLWHGPEAMPGDSRSAEKEGAVGTTPLVHEEGDAADHARVQGERQNGESMGPFPTAAAGNTGPAVQSAAANYATRNIDRRTNVTHFAVRPGRINLGILTRSFYVPTSAVESVSMERVLLTVERVPRTWHHKPRHGA
jgi:hypothetical protein